MEIMGSLDPKLSANLASLMHRKRYGNIRSIWHQTGGRCHLCHEPVNLATYGLGSIFGSATASVDHLITQYHGGGDDSENLRIAHQGCNSHRGINDYLDVRLALAGSAHEPLSTGKRVGAVVGSTLGVAAVAATVGALSAGSGSDKQTQKRAKERAIVGAVVGGTLTLLLGMALAR